MNLINLLKALCSIPAPSGREEPLRQFIKTTLTPYGAKPNQDRAGNLQVWLGLPERPCLMLDAHMDEVGIMVQDIEKNGCLRIVPIGGIEAALMTGTRVLLQSSEQENVIGLVGAAPPHVNKDGDKSPLWENIFLDIGAANKNEVKALGIEIGSCGIIDIGFGELGRQGFYARNLDNRVGCALLLWLYARLRDYKLNYTICFNFSSGEEVGLRGATSAAFHIKPQMALVLEATVADTPGLPVSRQPTFIGQGPAVTVMDGRQIVPENLVQSLEKAGARAGVASQRKRPPFGGTNGGAIAVSRGGVPTAVLSVPVRYIHSPVSWLNTNDLFDASRLLEVWVKHYCPLLDQQREI
jgi:endoglucanase